MRAGAGLPSVGPPLPRGAPPALVALVFLATLGGTGAWVPYLGLWLDRTGHSGAAIGAALAVVPFARLVAGPFWAAVADRFQRGERALQVASVVSTGAAAVALASTGPAGLGIGLLAFALARAPVGPLLDAQAVRSLEARGRDTRNYGRVRLWGSLGFLAVGAVGGFLADASPAAPLLLAVGCWAVAAALTFTLPASPPSPPVPVGPALRALTGRAFFAPFLAGCALHGAALTSYDSLYAVHVGKLGLPSWWTGAALAAGIGVEVVVMASGGALLRRFSPLRLVAASMAVGAARWALTATVHDPIGLTAVQALHGFSFGAFWIGSVEAMRARAPETIRASAQALFGSVAYGVGALLSAGAAFLLLDSTGPRGIYAAGAVASAAASLLVAFADRRERRAGIRDRRFRTA